MSEFVFCPCVRAVVCEHLGPQLLLLLLHPPPPARVHWALLVVVGAQSSENVFQRSLEYDPICGQLLRYSDGMTHSSRYWHVNHIAD